MLEEELRREKSALESANEKTSEDHAVVVTERDALMARESNLEQLLAAARGDLELANTDRDRALMANENLQRALEDLQCERDAEISLLAEQQRASEDAIVDAHAASMEATREAYAAEMRDVQYAADKSVQNALTEMDNMESTIQVSAHSHGECCNDLNGLFISSSLISCAHDTIGVPTGQYEPSESSR